MTWWRVGSSPATAARTATVFPAPTSPVITPSRIWSMQKLIRAVAWAWAWRANRSPAAIAFPNGVRASPKCAAHGARLASAVRLLVAGPGRQPGEVDRGSGAGLLVAGGGDHAEVVDPGRVRRRRRRRGDGTVHVPADHERHRGPGRPAVQEHLDHRQVLRVVAQLDTPAREGGINGVGITFQRDGRDPGHPPGHRPAERLPDQGRVRLPARAAGTEPVDGRLPGLGVHPPAGDLPGPRREPVVELVQRLD